MAVEVSLGPTFDASAPDPLIADTFWGSGNVEGGEHTYYDVMPDGKLIMLEGEGAREGTYVKSSSTGSKSSSDSCQRASSHPSDSVTTRLSRSWVLAGMDEVYKARWTKTRPSFPPSPV